MVLRHQAKAFIRFHRNFMNMVAIDRYTRKQATYRSINKWVRKDSGKGVQTIGEILWGSSLVFWAPDTSEKFWPPKLKLLRKPGTASRVHKKNPMAVLIIIIIIVTIVIIINIVTHPA